MCDIKVTSQFRFKSASDVTLLLEKIKTNEQERELIEKMTQEQSRNIVWRMARMRRLTASNFGRVIQTGDAKFLLSEEETERSLTLPMMWGIKNEKTARELYVEKNEVVVDKIGFLCSESGILGGTPDGIVKSERKLIEIKCPFTLAIKKNRGSLENRIKSGKFWLKLNKEGEVVFNMRHQQGVSYFHQIQGCLYLANNIADSCDLVVWGPCDWKVINIKKFPDWFSCYGSYLEHFWKVQVAPEICRRQLKIVSINVLSVQCSFSASLSSSMNNVNNSSNNNMEQDRPWPTVEYVNGFNAITSINRLKRDEVYIMIDFQVQFTRDKKALGVLTVIDKNLKEYRVWSVTAVDSLVEKSNLPKMMVYQGLKDTRGGKKMHSVSFASITERYKWIREYCEKRKADKVSSIEE